MEDRCFGKKKVQVMTIRTRPRWWFWKRMNKYHWILIALLVFGALVIGIGEKVAG